MKRLTLLLAALIALGGCYYKSSEFLLSGIAEQDPTLFFPVGTHYFLAPDNNAYVEVRVTADSLRVIRRNRGPGTDYQRAFDGIVTVIDGAEWKGSRDFHVAYDQQHDGKYEYYPFLWNASAITWVKADETGEPVRSLQELKAKVAEARRKKSLQYYALLEDSDAKRLVADDHRRQQASDAKKALAKAEKQSPPARKPTLDLMPLGAPTESDVRNALQAQLERAEAQLDALASGCKTFRANNNPLEALGCLMTGGGAINSKRFNVRITSLSLERCMATAQGLFLCRYRVKATGNSGGNPMLGMLFFSSRLGGVTDATFTKAGNGQWRVERIYQRCTYTETGAQCSYSQ